METIAQSESSVEILEVETLDQSERRTELRRPVSERAVLSILDPLEFRRYPVQLVDISSGGLRFLSHKPLAVGALLQVRLTNSVAMAAVRHCRPARRGYSIGVKIDRVFALNA